MPAQTLDIHGSRSTPIYPSAVEASTDLIHEPAANTAAVVTLSADTARGYVVSQVFYSYSATPTGGGIKIESPASTTFLNLAVTAAGPGVLTFDPPLQFPRNTNVVITLAAGSGSVVGKLVVNAWKLV